MEENIFQLPDTRKLSYCYYGPKDGKQIFYFHGTPSSRLEPLLLNAYNKDLFEILRKYNIRLIAVDRPGMGLSSFNPQGTFRTFGEDVTMLAMHLKIEATEVLCWSGGGPYALALAYHFPKFICSVHIISGFTRSFSEKGVFKNMNGNVYYFAASKYMSPLMKGIMTWAGRQKPNKPLPQWLSKLPDADHALMTHSHAMQHLSTVTLNEAARNGSKGLVHEAGQYFQETGYILSQIQQPVHYWWGTLDNTVTRVHAEAIDKQVPKGIVHYKDNEGHLSIYINYFEEVLAQIAYDK